MATWQMNKPTKRGFYIIARTKNIRRSQNINREPFNMQILLTANLFFFFCDREQQQKKKKKKRK
jgi:hypothetical protein